MLIIFAVSSAKGHCLAQEFFNAVQNEIQLSFLLCLLFTEDKKKKCFYLELSDFLFLICTDEMNYLKMILKYED